MTPPEGERAKLAGEARALLRDKMIELIRDQEMRSDGGWEPGVGDLADEYIDLCAAAVAEAESKVAALEALVVRLSKSLAEIHSEILAGYVHHKTVEVRNGNVSSRFRTAELEADQALALVPADLADCVALPRTEWQAAKDRIDELIDKNIKGAKANTALEAENKRLVAVLGMVKSSIREKDGGVIKLAYFTPSEVLMIDLALAPADQKVSKAALQPAPKV